MRKKLITTAILLTMATSCVGCSIKDNNTTTDVGSTAGASGATPEESVEEASGDLYEEVAANTLSYAEMVKLLEDYRKNEIYANTGTPNLSAFPITKTFNYKNADSDYCNYEFRLASSTPDFNPAGIITDDISDFDGDEIPELVCFILKDKNEDSEFRNYTLSLEMYTVKNNEVVKLTGYGIATNNDQSVVDDVLHNNHKIYVDYVTDGQKNYFSIIRGRTTVTNDRIFNNYDLFSFDKKDEDCYVPLLTMQYAYDDKCLYSYKREGRTLLYKDSSSGSPEETPYSNYTDAIEGTFKEYGLSYNPQLDEYNPSSLIKHYATFKITSSGVRLESDSATATFECETEYYKYQN